MRATIVIPLLKQKPAWLRRSVESALAQTVRCEVIVVTALQTPADNYEVLDALQSSSASLRVITAGADCGYACSINLGISAARTERVGFLLADDWLEANAVESCLEYSEDIVSTQMTTFDAEGSAVLEVSRITNDGLAGRSELIGQAEYLGHFLLFRRSRLLEVGGVDTTVGTTGPDDFDLLWTLREAGASARIVELPLYNYRDHGEDWRLTLRGRDEQKENLEKIFDKHQVPDNCRDVIRRRHERWFGSTIGDVRKRQASDT